MPKIGAFENVLAGLVEDEATSPEVFCAAVVAEWRDVRSVPMRLAEYYENSMSATQFLAAESMPFSSSALNWMTAALHSSWMVRHNIAGDRKVLIESVNYLDMAVSALDKSCNVERESGDIRGAVELLYCRCDELSQILTSLVSTLCF